MKRGLCLLLALAICAGLAVPVFADRLLKPIDEASPQPDETTPAISVAPAELPVLLEASLWKGDEETVNTVTDPDLSRQATDLLREAAAFPEGVTPPSSITGVNLYLDFPGQARLHLFTSAVRAEGFAEGQSYLIIRHMDQYYTAPGGTMDRLTELLFPQTVALWAALEDPDSPESAARDYYNFLSPRLSRSEYGGLEFTDDRRGLVLWQTPEGGVTPALVAQLTTAYHGRTCPVTYKSAGRSAAELDEIVEFLEARRGVKGTDTITSWGIDRVNGLVILHMSGRWPELNAAMREKGYTDRVRFHVEPAEG